MVNQSFDEESVDEIIASVENWARKYAGEMVGFTDGFYDDLVQEARIQIWKTVSANEEVNKSYLIQAMRWRMLSVIRERAKKNNRTIAVDFNDINQLFLESPGSLEFLDWTHHQKEIFYILNEFRPPLREYLIRRFWLDQHDALIAKEMNVYPSRVSRWWNNQIQPKLVISLAHLKE